MIAYRVKYKSTLSDNIVSGEAFFFLFEDAQEFANYFDVTTITPVHINDPKAKGE